MHEPQLIKAFLNARVNPLQACVPWHFTQVCSSRLSSIEAHRPPVDEDSSCTQVKPALQPKTPISVEASRRLKAHSLLTRTVSVSFGLLRCVFLDLYAESTLETSELSAKAPVEP